VTELQTARLLLRHWRDTDYAPFASLNADPEAMRYFPAPLSRTESDALADRIRTSLDENGWGLWAVEVGRNGEFAGFVGLAEPGFEAHFIPAVEIGWRLLPATWGNGYATEAARAALAFGFGALALDEIVSMTTPANTRSLRVMTRLGMTRDPEDDFQHPRLPPGHPLRPHVLYRLSRSIVVESAPSGGAGGDPSSAPGRGDTSPLQAISPD
jgi:RimJ/RimL family protein N-acetyltransferase